MNTTVSPRPTTHPHLQPDTRTSAVRRFPGGVARLFGVVIRPHSYRQLAYLLLGLPLATVWFAVLVTALSTSVSLIVVALLGLPLLLGTWYVIRAFANVERGVANVLVDTDIPMAPMASGRHGNLWARFKAMTSERSRWRELGYLVLRFPVSVATFTAAVTALTVPVVLAYAPIQARRVEHPFGDWFWSSQLEDFASRSPWSWLLVPLGLALLIVAFHLTNALARACGRWASAWLGTDPHA